MTTRAQPRPREREAVEASSGPRPPRRSMRRLGPVFGAVWLVYLAYPWSSAWSAPAGAARLVSLASVVAFATLFVVALSLAIRSRGPGRASPRAREAWLVLVGEGVLVACMALAGGESALAGLVFMAVSAVFMLALRRALVVVVVLAVAGEGLPRVVEGWENDAGIGVQVVLAAFAIFGVTQVMARNAELAAARTELADLAVARERERMARDVHDLLGHSLTVITVKSELAGRLLERDAAGAAREIADIEALARSALADVRSTVQGFRVVSLAGELASARVALTAMGIDAELSTELDDVPDDLRDVFAWAVREGVTNVIRHSASRRCVITVRGGSAVVSDDGRGPGAGASPSTTHARGDGTGLVGLRERAESVGATVSAGRSAPGGFELRVERQR